jgi:hypothetical protein
MQQDPNYSFYVHHAAKKRLYSDYEDDHQTGCPDMEFENTLKKTKFIQVPVSDMRIGQIYFPKNFHCADMKPSMSSFYHKQNSNPVCHQEQTMGQSMMNNLNKGFEAPNKCSESKKYLVYFGLTCY